MHLLRLLTSFTGRIGRRGFWLGMLALLGAGAAAKVSVTPDLLSDDPFAALLSNLGRMGPQEVAIYLALLMPAMALVVKRLHDRNKSGLYAALFWAPALVKAITALSPSLDGAAAQVLWGIDWLTAWIGAVGIWFFIELGLYGPVDPNRYGADPRA